MQPFEDLFPVLRIQVRLFIMERLQNGGAMNCELVLYSSRWEFDAAKILRNGV